MGSGTAPWGTGSTGSTGNTDQPGAAVPSRDFFDMGKAGDHYNLANLPLIVRLRNHWLLPADDSLREWGVRGRKVFSAQISWGVRAAGDGKKVERLSQSRPTCERFSEGRPKRPLLL